MPAMSGKLGFAWDYRLGTNRGQESTPLVIDGVMYATSNFGRVYALDAATRRGAVEIRPAHRRSVGALCLLRRRQSRTRGLRRAALRGRARRLAARARRAHRPAGVEGRHADRPVGAQAVHAHRRAAAGRRSHRRRQWRRRFRRCARLRIRVRPQERRPALALLHGAAQSRRRPAGSAASRGGREDLGSAASVGRRQRRHRVGRDGLRPGAPAGVHRHRRTRRPTTCISADATGGDELYAASIIAVHADNGSLAWYYQTVPGDRWDFDSTQKLVLADIDLDGRRRQVVMQAAKNGFYYVLDRTSGELLSAHNFAFVNWTRGIDSEHRPTPRRPARRLWSWSGAGVSLRGRRAQLAADGLSTPGAD